MKKSSSVPGNGSEKSGGGHSEKNLFLICNAHLDPVWLWPWEEGAAEALSTFRTAADFCEKYRGFVFNHNEAVLYRWVQEYDPALFQRIRKLVQRGRWHVMGGWFIQPDCNIPSGESFVRQILKGIRWFEKNLKTRPHTAINFDPFGHSRGLVQILKKSGFDSYLFCRPDKKWLTLPSDDFLWKGYDGSVVKAHRASLHYNTARGRAKNQVERWIRENPGRKTGILLWGIGDHGGGPSKEDLENLQNLQSEGKGWNILHGTPEDYFDRLGEKEVILPQIERDLNPWAVGTYTSMALVKQKHRLLENMYALTEKMATQTHVQGLTDYPSLDLDQALEDLLFCQFHDILPGSSIADVEQYALQRMDHGLEILSRIRAKSFFAALAGFPSVQDGEFPIFVHNPHPFAIDQTVVGEFQMLEGGSFAGKRRNPILSDESGNPVPCQMEKEGSNLDADWRKRIVFHAKMEPGRTSRWICRLGEPVVFPAPGLSVSSGEIVVKTKSGECVIDVGTGLLRRFRIGETDFLESGSFKALVCEDDADSWGMRVRAFRDVEGEFVLAEKAEAAWLSGLPVGALGPVRIVEQGPIRTIVESLFKYRHSYLSQRIKIGSLDDTLEVEIRVWWNEKDRMLKLSVPTAFHDGQCLGQDVWGVKEIPSDGNESVFQRWAAVVSRDRTHALSVVNGGSSGLDFLGGEIRFSLLRSPAYSGHPVAEGHPIVFLDRLEPRMDQGERIFRFWVSGGEAAGLLGTIDREAQARNEAPMVLSCNPSGTGTRPDPVIVVDDASIIMTAMKMSEDGTSVIVRFFEPTGSDRSVRVSLLAFDGMFFDTLFHGFEVKTFSVNGQEHTVVQTDLLERAMASPRVRVVKNRTPGRK